MSTATATAAAAAAAAAEKGGAGRGAIEQDGASRERGGRGRGRGRGSGRGRGRGGRRGHGRGHDRGRGRDQGRVRLVEKQETGKTGRATRGGAGAGAAAGNGVVGVGAGVGRGRAGRRGGGRVTQLGRGERGRRRGRGDGHVGARAGRFGAGADRDGRGRSLESGADGGHDSGEEEEEEEEDRAFCMAEGRELRADLPDELLENWGPYALLNFDAGKGGAGGDGDSGQGGDTDGSDSLERDESSDGDLDDDDDDDDDNDGDLLDEPGKGRGSHLADIVHENKKRGQEMNDTTPRETVDRIRAKVKPTPEAASAATLTAAATSNLEPDKTETSREKKRKMKKKNLKHKKGQERSGSNPEPNPASRAKEEQKQKEKEEEEDFDDNGYPLEVVGDNGKRKSRSDRRVRQHRKMQQQQQRRGQRANNGSSQEEEDDEVEEEEEEEAFDQNGYPLGVVGDDGTGKLRLGGWPRQRTKRHQHQRGRGRGRRANDGSERQGEDGGSSKSNNGSSAPGKTRNNVADTAQLGGGNGNGNGNGGGASSFKSSCPSDPDKTTNSTADNGGNGTGNKLDSETERKRGRKQRRAIYTPHLPLAECLERYLSTPAPSSSLRLSLGSVVRGKIRMLPKKSGGAFVTCDRGYLSRDAIIEDAVGANRALDGDTVYVELLGSAGRENEEEVKVGEREAGDESCGDVEVRLADRLADGLKIADRGDGNENDEDDDKDDDDDAPLWRDDDAQRSLWNPVIPIRRREIRPAAEGESNETSYVGRVVGIAPPRTMLPSDLSELNPSGDRRTAAAATATRAIVGTVRRLPGPRDWWVLEPRNKALPRFMCPSGFQPIDILNDGSSGSGGGGGSDEVRSHGAKEGGNNPGRSGGGVLYRAEHVHGSWSAFDRWPPCRSVRPVGGAGTMVGDSIKVGSSVSSIVEYETEALLVENGVDHGEFPPDVLRETEEAVRSGLFASASSHGTADGGVGWRPTTEMFVGRRDLRSYRIFTIDPTTARDLDDALHVRPLPDGRVEIGVHIADVSHFVKPGSAVDAEALRRSTTVYLVDRTVPMLPRKLCEIACSLNENVERLAFSVIWRMNMDGTLENRKGHGTEGVGKSHKRKKKNRVKGGNGKDERQDYDVDVWFGRSVIKSCARLDYATAQNIIEGKVATGKSLSAADENLWPESRRPTGGHSVDDVAADVRLMHRVAMARRRLRFENGALTLNGVKLTFQLGRSDGDDDDGEGKAPELAEPYPIRDSNRLVEEYMLLANYLVAQRLLERAGGRALLRLHPPPLQRGLKNVVDIAKEAIGFDIDATSSRSLQSSLSLLGRTCRDDLVLQCVTELVMVPMKPAQYVAAGQVKDESWRHFALNIPYYTHFTSPIRRYPDVVVHRLLTASLEGPDAVEGFHQTQGEIHSVAEHCNDKRLASKSAQDRSDRVFLSLFLRATPARSELGIVLSVGEKAFAVFVPSLALNANVFTEEHGDRFDCQCHSAENSGKRRIVMRRKGHKVVGDMGGGGGGGGDDDERAGWDQIVIKVFAKIRVSCICKIGPPIDVSVLVEGPWEQA